MASANCSEEGQYQIRRISDVQYEPRKMLQPIDGYEKMPLVSLEQAIQSLVGIVPDIQRRAYIAKQRAQDPKDGLTQEESAAICLYSMEWSPECVYSILNRLLRSEQRRLLQPWFSYLKLVLTALWKLPSAENLTVYRGITLDLSKDYQKGETIVWWGFSSATMSIDVLNSEQFLGTDGVRTLFSIETSHGKIIRNHSFFQMEDEVLLLPATHFLVTGKLNPAKDLHILTMKEVASPFPFLEPPYASAPAPAPAPASAPISPSFGEIVLQKLVNRLKQPRSASTIKDHASVTNPLTTKPNEKHLSKTEDKPMHHDNKKVTELIRKFKEEEHWFFNQQVLTDEDIRIVSEELNTNRFCNVMDLSANKITQGGAHYLAEMLKVNSSLGKLWLNHNQIGDDGCTVIFNVLKNQMNTTLQVLGLNSNKITDKSVKNIAEILTISQLGLKYLWLDGNQISQHGKEVLTKAATHVSVSAI